MILIKVEENTKRFIDKCIKQNIELHKIKYVKDYLIVLIDEKDLDRITKLNYYSKITVIEYAGIKKIILNIKQYSFDIIMLIIAIIILYITSNFIIDIDIKHENTKLKERVKELLISKDIKPYQFHKSYAKLNEISDEILQENRDFLDWISIDRKGMKYIISFEERIITKEKDRLEYCDVIADKDGIIKTIVSSSGINLVEREQYVKKGDILISGDIINNEEIKAKICASGSVYAEVWYRIDISVPLNYKEKIYTDSNRYNLTLNGNNLFKKKFDRFDRETILSLGPLKLIKELEYDIEDKRHNVDEAKEEGLNLARKRLQERIGKKTEIISEKVLKEDINNSKIDIEVFMSAIENIGIQKVKSVGDIDDT